MKEQQRRPGRYPAELRERAVRMVFEAEQHTGSRWAAMIGDCGLTDYAAARKVPPSTLAIALA